MHSPLKTCPCRPIYLTLPAIQLMNSIKIYAYIARHWASPIFRRHMWVKYSLIGIKPSGTGVSNGNTGCMAIPFCDEIRPIESSPGRVITEAGYQGQSLAYISPGGMQFRELKARQMD